jgi:hypothetical protein
MDERHMVEALGKLVGVVTALETQMQAVLLAAAKAGMDPDDVRRAIDAMPDTVVPSLGRDAYDQAMAGFERRLEQAALQRDDDLPETGKPIFARFVEALRGHGRDHAPAARIRDEEGEGDEGRDDLSTPPSQRS